MAGSIPRRIRGVAALGAVAALALGSAACSAGSTAAAPVATTQVDLPASYRFAPASISISSGATVTWTNHDHFTHSVQFLDGGLPTDPQTMKPGEVATLTFASPGTYHYQCSLHPQNMKGTVVVTSP